LRFLYEPSNAQLIGIDMKKYKIAIS